MKKIICILSMSCCILLCACSTSYEKHIDNINEYISDISEKETTIKKENSKNTITADISRRIFVDDLISISKEYEQIESDEDKQKFLNYLKEKIPQETYDICSKYIDEEYESLNTEYINKTQIHEDIWALYNKD